MNVLNRLHIYCHYLRVIYLIKIMACTILMHALYSRSKQKYTQQKQRFWTIDANHEKLCLLTYNECANLFVFVFVWFVSKTCRFCGLGSLLLANIQGFGLMKSQYLYCQEATI